MEVTLSPRVASGSSGDLMDGRAGYDVIYGTIMKVRMLGTLPMHLFQHSHTPRIAVMKSWSLNERGPQFVLGAL